jgi:hypothetical protein
LHTRKDVRILKIEIITDGLWTKIIADGKELSKVAKISTNFEVGYVPKVEIETIADDTTIKIGDADLFIRVFDRKFRVLEVLE